MKNRIVILIFGILGASCVAFGFAAQEVYAASNIDPQTPNHWAWNDVIGWIDFCESNGTDCGLDVEVTDTKVDSFASSSVGFIELDCATTSAGDVCGSPNTAEQWFVSNDGQGGLAGWAWNNTIGWISFCGDENGGSTYSGSTWVCGSSGGGNEPQYPYQVVIDGQTGDFSGYAWSDAVGWISFNCGNPGTNGCGVNYKVNTSWRATPQALPEASLTSSTFDTCALPQAKCGAGLNSIVWVWDLEDPPAGDPANYVRFQIATSDAVNGPWNFVGYDGTGSTYYSTSIINNGVSGSISINQANHLNQRYVKYKIFLNACNPNTPPPLPACAPAVSPVIKDVILNWSP